MVFNIKNKFVIKRKTLDDMFKHKNISNTITTVFTDFITIPQPTITIGSSIINGDVVITGNLIINGSLKVNNEMIKI